MSSYALMTSSRYEEIKSDLTLGSRSSNDGSEYIAKLKDGQTPERTEIKTHREALEITNGPGWLPDPES